jgi:hypothetical protein
MRPRTCWRENNKTKFMQNRIQTLPSGRALVWMLLAGFLMAFGPAVQAAKILYVQDFSRRDTVKLINLLRAQGHDLTVWTVAVSGNVLTAQDYANQGYQLLIVDEVVGSGNVGAAFKDSPIPVINWEGFLYSDGRSSFNAGAGLSGGTFTDAATAAAVNSGAGADFGQVQSETNINIVLPSHPLAAGLPAGLTAVFAPNTPPVDADGSGVITFAGARTFVPGATVVATVPGWSSGYCVFAVDVGVTNFDGVTTNRARWVHLPWNDTDEAERVMIEPSFFLFEAAVAWTLNLAQPTKIRNFLPASAGFQSTNLAVSFAVDKTTAAGSSVFQTNIQLRLNGSNVTSSASITDGGTQWNVTYNTVLQKDKAYTIIASATAANGGFSARLSQIDTFNPSNYSFEAEDFNFGGGGYFDTIVLCTNLGGTTPNCYFDRVGFTNIDKLEVNFTVAATPVTNEVYRFGSGFQREEFTDTFLSGDALARQQYTTAGIPEYEIRNIAANEWVNYTRTFPTGVYTLYARVASAAPMTVQADLVGGDPTTTNQTPLSKLGRFVKAGGTAGYEMVPLTDDSGTTALVLQFTNSIPRTIRMTAISAGFTPNFYMLVPTTLPPNQPPSLTLNSPTNGALLSELDVTTISVNPIDTDGTITNVQFFAGILGATGSPTLIGEDAVAPYSFPFTPAKLGGLNYYTIQVTAKDNGGLSATTNITVKVLHPAVSIVSTADRTGADAQVTENDGGDTGSGTSDNINCRIQIATGTTNRHEVIALRFDVTPTNLASISSVSLNMLTHRALPGRIIHVYAVTNGTVGLDNGTNGVHGFTDNDWPETGTSFSTMPGLIWDGQEETKGLTNVMDCGTLTIAKNKAEVWSYKSAQLLNFLRNNPDAQVTFLLETDTDNTGQLRFCTKETVTLDSGAPVAPSGTTNWFAPFLSFTTQTPTLNLSRNGNALQLSWVGAFKLQAQTNSLSTGIGSTWSDYPNGGASPVNVTITPGNPTVFYRLSSP